MKKLLMICLAAALNCAWAFAQNDSREPGLYAIIDGQSVPMTYISAISSNSTAGVLGVSISKEKVSYKGPTSQVIVPAKAQFEMVCDMNKKAIVRTPKKYGVFVSTINPTNIIIIPLDVKKNKREYDEGKSINGIRMKGGKAAIDFIWEQISDNSYRIWAEFVPGEYAIAFQTTKHGDYDLTAAFDFTVAAPAAE